MNNIVNLKVVRMDRLSKFYIVEYESKLYKVHMMPEQLNMECPDEITCSVHKSKNNYIISQDLETLLRRHYKEGDEVVYTISSTTQLFYFLKDEYGYHTYLDKKYQINPIITPKLRCRIKSITSKRTNVELVEKISVEESQFTIGREFLKGLFQDIDDCAESITGLLLSDNVMGSFDSECHRWIHEEASLHGKTKEELAEIRTICQDVLETTPMLKRCTQKERNVLEERFSILIEQLGYYISAMEFVEEGTEEETIDNTLNRLKETGFVYHPKKKFYIMMCLFLIKSKDEDNSAFLDKMMPSVYDTIRSNDIENWQRQPFKIVWIKLLEYFITTLYKNQDRLTEDKESLRNMLVALALQFNLIEDNDEVLVDSTLNLARLYRFCSMIGVLKPMDMLDKAYLTLIGAIQEKPTIIRHTSDAERMANVLYNMTEKYDPDIYSTYIYEGEEANIVISNDSIRIEPKEKEDEMYDSIPEHLELWNNLQVSLFNKQKPIQKLMRKKVNPYKAVWNDINISLFSARKKVEKKEKEALMLDEIVSIIITKQTAAETPTFECSAIKDGEIVGNGTIRMADMVGYATPTVGLFSFEKNGKPLMLEAYVTKKNADGTYVFEMSDCIDDFVDEYRYANIQYNDRLFCVVTGGNTLTPFFAVSQQGLPISVKYDADATPINMPKGTVIEVSCIEKGKHGFMMGTFVRMAPEYILTLADAFGTLMNIYSHSVVYEVEDEIEEEEEIIQNIERNKVVELMHIIENVASLENDYIKAYNYLAYSKLIAHIIGATEQELFYDKKMSLIELLHDFDTNDSISEDKLAGFELDNANFFDGHSSLHRSFRKLQLVSYLGSESHKRELCELACDDTQPDFAQLAQLVTSYNFMQQMHMVSEAESIHEHIKELLQLQKKENPKKNYGQETYTQEFKSSIVIPQDSTTPDIKRQTHKIMEEICAFLNADGGRLYIGVDDKTHLEKGVDEELKYFENSRDKFDLHVRTSVNKLLSPGELADHCINTYFDEEAQKAVYVIDIKPCPKPISIDGVFYERRGTSARRVSEEYQTTFISNRLKHVSDIGKDSIEQIIEEAKNSVQVEEDKPVEVKKEKDAPLEYSTDFEDIKTSVIRKNQHKNDDIQEGDLPYFINIFEDNTYSITDMKQYGCLSVGIYDEEQDGSLIVVYATGEISKISIRELLQTNLWEQKPINNKSRIVFVSPAQPNQILSVLYHSKNTDYYRFMTVDNLERGTFNTSDRPFYSGPIDEIIECEILTIGVTSPYKNFLDNDKDVPGADAEKKDGKKAIKLIKELKK